MLILGVDLAGSESRPTGLCLLRQDMGCRVWVVYRDSEIVEAASLGVGLVAVDAPLSLPSGACGFHFRRCDLELRRLGVRLFPVTLGPMRMLTERGVRLRKMLERLGVEVIEVFPGATQDLLGLPRKSRDLTGLVRGLRKLGLKCLGDNTTGDEADAATCALTGLMYLRGEAVKLGDPDEGVIVIPRPEMR